MARERDDYWNAALKGTAAYAGGAATGYLGGQVLQDRNFKNLLDSAENRIFLKKNRKKEV